ncbi:MAG TPA: flagellar biosynthetic protein FliR [Solirubrobacteraceae bacterium]|jgi:flagellar biosynthetic protein FliR|nr:flagellar biosynthetic protein FliR [Solirubrobacteraceae bacterium]
MTPVLQQLGEQQVAGFFLVLARVSPLFVLAPLFSSQLMPPRVRGIVAVALAIGLVPVVARDRIATDTFGFAGLVGKELLVGLAFAFALGALFAALNVAGTFLDTSIGFSFGSIVDPISNQSAAVLAQLYALIGVLVFIAIGGDAWVVQGLARTYELVPLESFPSLGALTSGTLAAFVGIFAAAIQVAGPVLLALILTDAAFGMVSRVVPQLNVFAVGFAAKIVVGLLILGVTLPFLAGWLSEELEASVSDALRMLRVG